VRDRTSSKSCLFYPESNLRAPGRPGKYQADSRLEDTHLRVDSHLGDIPHRAGNRRRDRLGLKPQPEPGETGSRLDRAWVLDRRPLGRQGFGGSGRTLTIGHREIWLTIDYSK